MKKKDGDGMTYQDWKDASARFIRYRMTAMGLSVEQLARRASLPVEYVRKCVKAAMYPTHKARSQMERALGCSLEFIAPKKAKEGS